MDSPKALLYYCLKTSKLLFLGTSRKKKRAVAFKQESQPEEQK
jgi:hypothetical protein